MQERELQRWKKIKKRVGRSNTEEGRRMKRGRDEARGGGSEDGSRDKRG